MKRLPLIALALLIQPLVLCTAYAQAPAQCDDCSLVEEALKAVAGLTPGTPRSKVELSFRADGGLQSIPGPTRYIFKKCPLIKIEVEFTHFEGQQDGLPSDEVVKVSRPYLEYPASD
jgi:hypothetical protein